MQIFDPRHQFHLHWHKIVVALLLIALTLPGQAQNENSENLSGYDNQWIHYGFLIGVHSARYKIQYADAFASPEQDSIHSVVPGHLPGWKVGFVVDMSLSQYLSFRVLPTVGFYEQNLKYRYTDGTSLTELKDATLVELPLLIKYKSARRGNIAMYAIGGFSPSLEASGRGDDFNNTESIELRNINYAITAGVGFDLYFPLFKFSPEVRYSWGVRNMLANEGNQFSASLKRLTYQNITFYITFEGGPSYLKHKKTKRRR